MVPRCSTTWRAVYNRMTPSNRRLSNHSCVSWISCSNDLIKGLLASDNKIEILGDPRPIPLEGLDVTPDTRPGGGEVVVAEVEVQEVDVPGRLYVIGNIGRNDFPGYGQGGCLRVVVDISVTSTKQLRVLLIE